MGATMGAHIVVATPEGKWAPNSSVVDTANKIAKNSGAKIEVLNDVKVAVSGASVVYTDVWMSMGDSESDRAEKMSALKPFMVTPELMALASSDSIFMHCLPAHRGEEVSAEVIDGPRSVVWRQAFHRRTTIQSLLYHLTRGDLKGNN
jgi:ornithine carbamoyltransferase